MPSKSLTRECSRSAFKLNQFEKVFYRIDFTLKKYVRVSIEGRKEHFSAISHEWASIDVNNINIRKFDTLITFLFRFEKKRILFSLFSAFLNEEENILIIKNIIFGEFVRAILTWFWRLFSTCLGNLFWALHSKDLKWWFFSLTVCILKQ